MHLLTIFISLLVISGVCECFTLRIMEDFKHWIRKRLSDGLNNQGNYMLSSLYVEVNKQYGTTGDNIECANDCTYEYEIGDTLDLTCKSPKNMLIMTWTDDDGYGTEPVMNNNIVKLKITPDRNDNMNLRLTCEATEYDFWKNKLWRVTVNLVSREASTKIQLSYATKNTVIPLKVGDSWRSTVNCQYGKIRLPVENNGQQYYKETLRKSVTINDTIITHFDKFNNATAFYCISYKLLSYIYDNIAMNFENTFGRLKEKFTFVLKEDTDAKPTNSTTNNITTLTRFNIGLTTVNPDKVNEDSTSSLNPKEEESKEREPEENKTTIKESKSKEMNSKENKPNGKRDNTAAIIGTVMGAVILVLVCTIIIVWHKNRRRTARRNNPAEPYVIYSELEERSAQSPPPPPRDLPAYAVIIGTLVPNDCATDKCTFAAVKRQTQPVENMYCNIK